MRLLNIYSLEIEDFDEKSLPLYFILSHRWEGKEITFKDFSEGCSTVLRGYRKIEEFCGFARIQAEDETSRAVFDEEKVEWVWIDTCMFVFLHET